MAKAITPDPLPDEVVSAEAASAEAPPAEAKARSEAARLLGERTCEGERDGALSHACDDQWQAQSVTPREHPR